MNRSRLMVAVCTVAAVLAVGVATTQAQLFPAAETTSVAHAAATCSDYPNQKAAQEAADTRDADGDGIYCVISPR